MDYEGLYEAFMAGIETAMPGGGLITAGRGALGQAVASEFDYGSTTPPPGTPVGTRTTTDMRPETRTTQAMHPEAAAILKQVTGQNPPAEEQTNELLLTEDLLKEITSGRRVVSKNDKLKSRPGQKGFSRGGKGYQPAEDPRISAARIRAGSERQKNNSAAFARIMAGVAQNPDVTPDKAAALARALLRGGQPVPGEDEELQTLLREAMKGGKLSPRLAELLSARHGG